MCETRYYFLAGVIAAHPGRTVHGRTRLQKTVNLLQKRGFPTDYLYTDYFYGPYSKGLYNDIQLLERFGLITEQEEQSDDGSTFYIIQSDVELGMDEEIKPYRDEIELMAKADSVVLELAATYQAFRDAGFSREEAIERLNAKKGRKCKPENINRMFELLAQLELERE